MTDLSQTLRDLPLTGLAPLLLMIAAGLLLWGAGRKVLRVGIGLGGLAVGGTIGWLAGHSMNLGVPPLVSALAGGMLLACVAALAYRITVAIAMAVMLAIAGPLIVIAAAELMNVPTTVDVNVSAVAADDSDVEKAAPLVDEPVPPANSADEESPESDSAVVNDADASLRAASSHDQQLAELRQYAQRLADAIAQKWQEVPAPLRPRIAIAAVVGGALGLLLGTFAGGFSAAAITALGGSLLWLTGFRILAMRLGVPEGPWLPASGIAFAGMWLAASLVGLIIQWIFKGGKEQAADK